MTPTATPTRKLSAAQARELHDAEVAYAKLEAALEKAKTRRETLRERYFPRLPLALDEDDAAKGIREATVGGVKIRVCPINGREYFDFSGYKAEHGLTDRMRAFLKRSKPSNRWTVKPEDGPKKIGAVEPS